jgi:hypothetical protein
MTDAERKTIREAMVTRGLEPMLRDNQRTEHNMQMLRASALGIGGMTLLGEIPDAQKYIDAARDYYKWFLDGRFSSNNTEGLMYTAYGVKNCASFADVLNRAAKDNSLLTHPAMDMIARWVLYFQGPGASGLTNFSDCSTANYYGSMMKILNNSMKNGYAGW